MIETEHFCPQCLAKYIKEHWNSLQEAKTEWVEVYEEVRINKDGLCICQRNKLKFIKYFYNVKTKNTIIRSFNYGHKTKKDVPYVSTIG